MWRAEKKQIWLKRNDYSTHNLSRIFKYSSKLARGSYDESLLSDTKVWLDVVIVSYYGGIYSSREDCRKYVLNFNAASGLGLKGTGQE